MLFQNIEKKISIFLISTLDIDNIRVIEQYYHENMFLKTLYKILANQSLLYI